MHLFIRRYLIAGLFVWIPIWVTLLVIGFLVGLLDSTLSLLPKSYRPEAIFGVYIPGLGVIVSLLIVFFTGMFVTNVIGRRLILWGEQVVNRIPLVSSIYTATKQVLETVVSSSSQSFRKVVLIEWPRKGLWSVAFQTGSSFEEAQQKTGDDMIIVFIPTTPNPTSGFTILVSRRDVIELEMSVEQALKFVISLGVVQPLSPLEAIKLKSDI